MTTDRPIRRVPPLQGYFITATDTGVGKTVVTAALAHRLHRAGTRVAVFKPVETGVAQEHRSDAEQLSAAVAHRLTADDIAVYRLPAPVAPLAAARARGTSVDVGALLERFSVLAAGHEAILVEGVGGVLVPLTEAVLVRDLIAALALPAVVVCRATLGGINHGLLTIEALAQRSISIAAVVLNLGPRVGADAIEALQTDTTAALLKEFTIVPVLGPLPHQPALDTQWETGLATLAETPAIAALADWLGATPP